MRCDNCGNRDLEQVADIGGQVLVRCACGHQQLVRRQALRGSVLRPDGEVEVVARVSGEIASA